MTNIEVVAGTLYRLRVKAKNKYGWGNPSSELEIYAATRPEAPAAPTTARNGISIRITWVPPDNNGLAIDQYEILIRQKDGTYSESAEC